MCVHVVLKLSKYTYFSRYSNININLESKGQLHTHTMQLYE